jgi:hypothetical protein
MDRRVQKNCMTESFITCTLKRIAYAYSLSNRPGLKFWLPAIFFFLTNEHRETQVQAHALSSEYRKK